MASAVHLLVRCFLFVALALLPATIGQAAAAELGEEITNVASLGYTEGNRRVDVLTNEATITVEAVRTDSTIEFFRHAPIDPSAGVQQINGSDYSPSGAVAGPFAYIGTAANVGGQPIDLSSPIPVSPAESFTTGELMFIRVTDLGQNGNPSRIETVAVKITASTGDVITLRLYESGVNTGEFWAYVPSTREAAVQNDTRLTTGPETSLTATYIDSFDATEVSIDTALVDPFGRVFNALTGELLDGVPVTIYDTATGLPARVYGVDGLSVYPSTVTTGSLVTDESGLTYQLEAGEFRFPLMAPGRYEVRVEAPENFQTSSILDQSAFAGLPNAPFAISTSSYGGAFTLTAMAPINFDIPLDPESDIVLTKTAEATTGDVGDFIRYSVAVANRGSQDAPITVRDTAPYGFRYIKDSGRLDNGAKLDDPVISADGRTLDFSFGTIASGSTVEFSYVMQIGAGVVPGESINAAVATGPGGAAISNIARAVVTIREDLFRTRSTIIGRVAENACDEDEEWAREIRDGTGIEGVRVYMETGEYALTDRDGLYHFEDITAGTHVVQIDKETLPAGYEPMVCEENTRYAGRATSKFVDVQGGNIWRANFYLKYTGNDDEEAVEDGFNDLTEYKDYDAGWLSTQTPDIGWVYPDPSRTPSQPSINIGVKHSPDYQASLALNGKAVPQGNYQSRDSNNEATVYMTRWRGVDLKEGLNIFTATFKKPDGSVEMLSRNIWFVNTATRATPVVDRSVLVADGRTSPVMAVRFEDDAGRPVHAGRLVTVDIESPYRLEEADRRESASELVSPLSATASVSVGSDGVALVKLEPTLQTGRVSLLVTLDDGRQESVEMYLKPEQRDWIIVGLAEGTLGYENIRRNASAGGDDDDVFTDGRVAFFAKGLIKGEWLLTLAVDTDKRRGDRDKDFDTEIDPNAYYTLYGDQTYQEQEAPSRYPLYVKLEKNQFYAMFGDYDTNITDGKLTRYTRRLSGLKTEYVGDRFRVVAFGAETNQGFVKEEIAADGTSGSYRLSNAPILNDSETIVVETRERFRPDRVLETRRLVRHIDYTLDNLSGELIFRLPIPVSDEAFNPNVIVIDYETPEDAERNFTYGGRVSGDFLDGKVTVGAAYIHEGGDAKSAQSTKDLAGVDVVARLAKGWEARAEIAHSRSDLNEVRTEATAWLAEITHRSENLTAEAYVRSEEKGFGLGQQASSTADARRVGARATYQFDADRDEETGRLTTRTASFDTYHEKNLTNGSTRILGEAKVSQDNDRWGVSAGIRHVQDNVEGGEDRQSTLALAGARLSIPEYRAAITLAHEQPLSGNDGVDAFPMRSTLGLTKVLNSWATATVTHEYSKGQDVKAHTTTAGLKITPWTGAAVTLGGDMLTQDSARRIGSTVGLDQQFVFDENWSASVGMVHHHVLHNQGTVEIVPDAALSPIEADADYSAAYAGIGYRTKETTGSARLEGRRSDLEDVYTASSSIVRELSEELSVAGSTRAQHIEYNDGAPGDDQQKADIKLGLAWRPRVEKTVILNRLDLKYENSRLGEKTAKVINNFAFNTPIGERGQLAGHYGVKYVMSDFGGDSYSSWTHLLGAEARYDVTRRIDLGLHGSILYSPGTGSKEYAWGPSIGVKPIDNLWLSLGYNFSGFDDDDFEAARYTREGLYLKLRLKFDEDTAREVLDFISPSFE